MFTSARMIDAGFSCVNGKLSAAVVIDTKRRGRRLAGNGRASAGPCGLSEKPEIFVNDRRNRARSGPPGGHGCAVCLRPSPKFGAICGSSLAPPSEIWYDTLAAAGAGGSPSRITAAGHRHAVNSLFATGGLCMTSAPVSRPRPAAEGFFTDRLAAADPGAGRGDRERNPTPTIADRADREREHRLARGARGAGLAC